jgi:dolichol-phosphate mannosyltransferase
MRVLIFTATYNEKENINILLKEIHKLYPNFHLLVIDDNSPDGTGEIVQSLCQTIPNLKLIKRHNKLGLGTAHQLAMQYALHNNYDRLVTMDADLSHMPSDIGRLINELDNADFVIGSRYMPGGSCDYSGYRKIVSIFANISARLLLGIPLHEVTTSFRAFRVPILKKLPYSKMQTPGYSFFMECVFRLSQASTRIVEIPIRFRDRFRGESKIPKNEIYRSIFKLLTLTYQRFFMRTVIPSVEPIDELCQFCERPYQIELYADRRDMNTSDEDNVAAAYQCTSMEHQNNPRVLKCLACGLVQVPPSSQREDLEFLYQSVEDTQYLENSDSRRRTFARAYRRILPFVGTQPGKLVEIGAYCGLSILEAQKLGWKCTGIEPSRWAVKYAKEKHELDLINGMLADNLGKIDTNNDLVVSWDVLEHVRDPVQFLMEASQMLKPGGHICISTLDYDNWFPKLAGQHWPWLMDMHLFYFTPDILNEMFKRAGCELVSVDNYVHFATLKYLWTKISIIPIWGLNRILPLFTPIMPKTIFIPVSFGDIKLYVARKN